MDIHDWPYIKKSAQRKKRLVKKDFDKQLFWLDRERQRLSDLIDKLPPIMLDKPQQRGWMRKFVLSRETQQGENAAFYQALLDKINTGVWHYDISFKRRKIRKGEYAYYDAAQQKLRILDAVDFHGAKLNLSDVEKALFFPREYWVNQYRRYEVRYVFAESWRFTLVIKPYMVYSVRQINELLEQEAAEIDNRIDNYNLQPRMWKLMGGQQHFWQNDYYKPYNQIKNELKNKPRYTSKDAYLDQ